MKVNILLSTYNGEKYIEDQLKSLMQQTFEEIYIYIRDDGSKDATVEKIKKFVECYSNKIYLYEGNNIGYKKSFQWLLQNCNDADYFAFCDQDDVWHPNKIENAVAKLEVLDNSRPNLYLCNFYWCNENMKLIRKNDAYRLEHSLEKYVTFGDRNAFGCTEVFNRKALECIKDSSCFKECSHDEIVYMFCKCNGAVFWDNKIGVYYRRHSDNCSKQELIGGNRFTHFIWRIKTFVLFSNKKALYKRMQAFYNSFETELTEENRKIFELYLGNKGRVKKFMAHCRYRDSLGDELSIRILFLLGKV